STYRSTPHLRLSVAASHLDPSRRPGRLLPGFAELAQGFFELFLGLAIGCPVATLDGVLAPLPRLPRFLREPHDRARQGCGGLAVGSARRRGFVAAHASSKDALERLLERRLHGDLVAEGHDDAAELRQRPLLGRE